MTLFDKRSMKILTILLSICFSFSLFALEKVNNSVSKSIKLETELAPIAEVKNSKFSLKEIVSNSAQFEQFLIKNISIISPRSPKEINSFIKETTKNLFIKNYTKETPLISEFVFQSIQKPEVIAKFLAIATKVNQLLIFSLVMILSIVLSHYLGELKFKFPAMSIKRISYSFFRFFLINGFRVWIFSFLFMENIKPISKVYFSSVTVLQDSYPALFTITKMVFQV